MTTLKTATVQIEGTRTLLFHGFFVEALSTAKKEKTGSAGNDPEEWKRTIFIDKDRQLFLPGMYFFSCFCQGAKFIKCGKGSIQPKMASTLQVLDEKIYFKRYIPENWELTQNQEESVYLDVRGVKNPSTKGKNVRYRVVLRKDWQCNVSIFWDSSIITIWICWGVAALAIGMAIIAAVNQQETKSWLSIMPTQGITVLFVTMILILYCANDSVKRKKENEQKMAEWQGELAAIKKNTVQEDDTTTLDPRLQSIEGIIGYLDQSIKMEYEPKSLTPIVLFLAKEIKKNCNSK